MKFETSAQIMKSALNTVGRVVERRNTIPILNTVLFERNKIRATDLDIEMQMIVPATTATGSAAIDHRSLANIVRHIPDDDRVMIEGGREGVTLTFSAGRYDLPALPPSDFPDSLSGDLAPVEIDGDKLSKALRFASHFISTEETRYYLNGICLDGRNAVATDGHRLGHHPVGSDLTAMGRMILPRKAISLICGLPAPKSLHRLTTNIGAEVRFDGVTIRTKSIDGNFPDWTRVVPENDGATSMMTVNRREMLAAASRINAFLASTASARYVTLSFYDGGAVIVTDRKQEGAAREYIKDARCLNEPRTICFSGRYLCDLLRVFSSNEYLNFAVKDEGSPCKVNAGEGVFAVLMPARSADVPFASQTIDEWRSAQDTRASA